LVGEKKTSRLANDGVVAADAQKGFGVLLEVSCETDFVARSEPFKHFAVDVLKLAMGKGAQSLEDLKGQAFDGAGASKTGTVAEQALELAGTIGENVVLRRFVSLSVGSGLVVPYVHQSFPETSKIGKLGVLVALESSVPEEDLMILGEKLAMHIAFTRPLCVSTESLPQEALDKEKKFLETQIQEESGDRPQEVQKKMVEGRLRKFRESVVLEEQDSIFDAGKKIKEVLAEESARLGSPIHVTGFVCIKLNDPVA
jgi:elongation factor Ts